MTDKDVMEKAASLVGVKVHFVKRRKPHHKDAYIFQIKGKKAVCLMTMLHPLMGSRRKSQIDAALATYDPTLDERKHELLKKLDDEALSWARLNAENLSLRARARHLGVNHETLRRRLMP